jgi:hypothetical protein
VHEQDEVLLKSGEVEHALLRYDTRALKRVKTVEDFTRCLTRSSTAVGGGQRPGGCASPCSLGVFKEEVAGRCARRGPAATRDTGRAEQAQQAPCVHRRVTEH